jgi:Flp pilus assembly protein TadD
LRLDREVILPLAKMRKLRRVYLVLASGLSGCLTLAALLVPPPLAAEGRSRRAIQADIEFAAEMAERGLWREALYRWERVLADRPDDARILNNVAVASEALGQFDRARAAYEKAATVARDRQILSNRQLFEQAQALRHSTPGEGRP